MKRIDEILLKMATEKNEYRIKLLRYFLNKEISKKLGYENDGEFIVR